MLSLRTLGGVYVANEQGQSLGGAASHRRILALLVALGVAGDRGLSRAKLLALLWPEADEERARHSLTQALYSARRALDVEDLILGGSDLRLNPERMQIDVQEMEAALDADDLERAVALYRGPFADGFFLPGSTEFEQWTSLQRAHLEDRIAVALDRLAGRADGAGQAREAVEWRKKLAAIRPLDASAAVALMTTLANAGDRAGALQHARLHETRLREELGLEPDPVVTSLVARLQAPVDWRPERSVADPDGRLDGPAALPAPAATLPPTRRWRDVVRWAAVGIAVTLAAFGLARLRPGQPAASRQPPAAGLEQSVVVAPFRVAGASQSLAYLREGLVELLSTRLADDSSARSVDAGAVLAAWRAAGLADSADVPRETMVRLASALGAERVVIGSVVGSPSRVVLTASAVAVASGAARGEVTVEGPADSISALVDRLAARLLLLGAGEDVPLASQTTGSLRSLRAFLDGQAAFRRASYTMAMRRYDEALRLDSTFALAALQLARTADRLQLLEPQVRAVGVAWPQRGELDARAHALLVALAGPDYPAPSHRFELVAAWERLIDLTPDRAEAWYEAGARLIQEGGLTGLSNAESRGRVALRRALQLDSTLVAARELLAQAGDATSRERAESLNATLPLAPFLEWRRAVDGDSAARSRAGASLAELGPRNLRAIALTALREGSAVGDARRAVSLLSTRAGGRTERVEAVLAEHAVALNEGRRRDALAATARLAEIQPGARAHLRLRVLDALYGDGDQQAAAAAAQTLEQSAPLRLPRDPADRGVQLADACVLAQWRLARRDTTGVRRTIDALRLAPLTAGTGGIPVSPGAVVCAELLEAATAVALGQPDAATVVSRVDSMALTVAVSGDAIAYAPILLGRLLERLGNSRAALDAVRRRDEWVGWPRYLAVALRDEARYASAAGAPEGARTAATRYLQLRAEPDAELRPSTAELRELLADLPAVPASERD
jgi:DNA-binding SARP family transcriptional activator